MRSSTLLILALLAGQILGQSCALGWPAKSKTIHDGDSFTTEMPNGNLGHIRLYGIDAPELKQSFGFQAKKGLNKLISRRTLDIEDMDTDRYGRTVVVVRTSEGVMANEEMVRSGLAWVYDQYCKREDICAPLRQAEAEARSAGRGLWAEGSPTPPWEWRKEHKHEEWYAKPTRVLKSLTNKIKIILKP